MSDREIAEDGIQPQRQVGLHGLAARRDLNGCPGRILGNKNPAGRWPVRVYRVDGAVEEVRVKTANLRVRTVPLFETLEDELVAQMLETAPPGTAAALLCCSSSLSRLAEQTWRARFHRLGHGWKALATRGDGRRWKGAQTWREKYASATKAEAAKLARRAAEPNPSSFRLMGSVNMDVSAEHKIVRDILDSPEQVSPHMSSYEGFLGQFKEQSVALGAALLKKGGRDLMSAFLEAYVHGVDRRLIDYAWNEVEGAYWYA